MCSSDLVQYRTGTCLLDTVSFGGYIGMCLSRFMGRAAKKLRNISKEAAYTYSFPRVDAGLMRQVRSAASSGQKNMFLYCSCCENQNKGFLRK